MISARDFCIRIESVNTFVAAAAATHKQQKLKKKKIQARKKSKIMLDMGDRSVNSHDDWSDDENICVGRRNIFTSLLRCD